jgi:hypothetical protein
LRFRRGDGVGLRDASFGWVLWMRVVMRAVVALWVIVLGGCANRVEPPRGVADAATVYIADHGLHASLLLPRREGGYREYSYGQWEWYAKGNDGSGRVFGVLFVPQGGAIGRTDWDREEFEDLRMSIGAQDLHAVRVERAMAASLLEDLDRRFDARKGEMFFNADHGLEFVPDDRRYWLAHGCTAQVNEWLRRLGCRVVSSAAWSEYQVAEEVVAEGER